MSELVSTFNRYFRWFVESFHWLRPSKIQLRKTFRFTIIELLIVVSILGIIFSLLSPNYKNLVRKSQQLQCKTILKTYQMAHGLYATDNEGFMVPIWRTVPYSPYHWKRRFWIGHEGFLSYLGVDDDSVNIPDSLQCPTFLESDNRRHSYGINKDPIGWVKDHRMNFNLVTQPSKKVYMIEGTDFHLGNQFADYTNRWDVYGETRLWSVAFRHEEGCNGIFLDGHVEYRSKQEWYYPNDEKTRKSLWYINRDAFSFK